MKIYNLESCLGNTFSFGERLRSSGNAPTSHSRAKARSGNASQAPKTPPKVNSLFLRQDTSKLMVELDAMDSMRALMG